jgi:ATP-binding cassette subfamily C (CFTR/MRP) protein 1
VALIRAIVRRPKILVLDEATGSLDPETDALIQRIIQTGLAGVTVRAPLHRTRGSRLIP